MKKRLVIASALCSAIFVSPAKADVLLGAFDFNSLQFGNTLSQSDGGVWAALAWLNVVNSNPGSPGYLTGANFNTGIANIQGSPIYTIGYNTPIVNGAGNDLGIVTARYSTDDTARMDVSTDGGTTFVGAQSFGPASAISTGVACSYYAGGAGPQACELFVTPVDLSVFGLALGTSINAVQITGSPQLDLIRVAGFGTPSSVPEPGSLALLGLGLAGLAASRRRKQ